MIYNKDEPINAVVKPSLTRSGNMLQKIHGNFINSCDSISATSC